ncbi:MAG: hypothetical protein QOJ64_1294 [Acidobacteriota bacterium]|nr:hypothetical protein [Acidobacteriota bacterium]
MNRRFYFSFLALALTVATAIALVAGNSTSKSAGLTSSAASALPASDFVIIVDVQRALNDALPTLLSSNPAALAKVNRDLAEFESKTGINPRVFESVAIGGTLRPNARLGRDPGAVVIVSGSFKSDELLATAFEAAKKESQFEKTEQQYEGKTIFVIRSVRRLTKRESNEPAPAIVPPAGVALVAPGPTKDSTASVRSSLTILEGHPSARLGVLYTDSDNFAVVALAPNMLAVGSVESVRASIDASLGRNRIDGEMVNLAMENPNTIVGFSGRIPQNSQKTDATNLGIPIANFFASVREFHGSFGLNGSDTESSIAVQLETSEQAREFSQAINSIKGLASFGVARSIGPDQASRDAIAAVLKGLTIDATGNELRIDLKIPQSSLAPLIRLHR